MQTPINLLKVSKKAEHTTLQTPYLYEKGNYNNPGKILINILSSPLNPEPYRVFRKALQPADKASPDPFPKPSTTDWEVDA